MDYKFKLRAEGIDDFLGILRMGIIKEFQISGIGGHPYIEVEFNSLLSMPELREKIKEQEDSHVMWQSLNHKEPPILVLKFINIDKHNRPVFRGSDNLYYGSCVDLFPFEETQDNVMEKLSEIVYFGTKFGCEPEGTPLPENTKIAFI